MKKGAFILIVFVLLWGCTSEPDCSDPAMMLEPGCCLDIDGNGICDIDEAIEAEPVVAETDDTDKGLNQEEPAAHDSQEGSESPNTEDGDTATPEPAVDLTKNTEEEAEKVGKQFASSWKSKQYNLMYAQFTDKLKGQKTVDEFKAIMELDPFYKNIREVIFKGVIMTGENEAELTITAKTNVQQFDIPGARLLYRDGWKVSAFVDVFELELFDAACSGYRYSNAYTTEDCAFDLAKKVKDASFCDVSKCHYVECLKALGKPAGMTQEAEQCKLCVPPMKTVNTCILDVAIKYDKISACNVISDTHYADRYCACYGRFAQHKDNSGYCNMINDPDYKDQCLKGYEGGYC